MRLQLILDVLKNTLDSETFFHSINLKRMVTDFVFFGDFRLVLKPRLESIREACLLHDIGKTHQAVKYYILTGEELARDKVYANITVVHTGRGREQLRRAFEGWGIGFEGFVLNVIKYHHDSWDRICDNSCFNSNDERVMCNVITAFDIIESLVSFRRYRTKIFSLDEALIILKDTNLIQPEVYESINNYFISPIGRRELCLL